MLESKTELTANFTEYLTVFPNENKRQEPFESFLDRNLSEALYTRKNFDGHITASAFILDSALENMLLIHHKFLDKWLQPGGHVDATDESIMAAAYREMEEETGITAEEVQLHQLDSYKGPFDIDSHAIPANDKKSEAGHVHHDFRYLFSYTGEKNIVIDKNESLAFRWFSLEELATNEIFQLVVAKIMDYKAQ